MKPKKRKKQKKKKRILGSSLSDPRNKWSPTFHRLFIHATLQLSIRQSIISSQNQPPRSSGKINPSIPSSLIPLPCTRGRNGERSHFTYTYTQTTHQPASSPIAQPIPPHPQPDPHLPAAFKSPQKRTDPQ